MRSLPRALPLALGTTLALGTLVGCSSDDSTETSGALAVTTSAYPLQYAVEQVGGEHVEVTNLTRPGVEPHDVELTPKDVLGLGRADLVVYLSGFQPAVDDAVAEVGEGQLDVADAARLITPEPEEHSDEEHSHEEHGHDDGHDHGPTDPHFWLDPLRLADVGDAIADRLGDADPDNAADFTANAKDLRERLTTLDREMRTGLERCEHRDLVTSHTAFGYLAEAYDLHQEGITGLTPESEPSAKALAEVVDHVKETGVSTIYAEPLAPRAVADTIAREAGVEVSTLDPLEGLTDNSAGKDYLEVMRANLATLRTGQQCD